MGLDDRFALGDGVEYLGNTVADVVAHDIAHEECGEGNTNQRRDQIPPGMFVGNEVVFYKPLDQVDKGFQQSCCGCGKSAYEER